LRDLSAGEAAADASFFDLTSVPECHALCGSAKVRVQLVFPLGSFVEAFVPNAYLLNFALGTSAATTICLCAAEVARLLILR